MNKLSIPTGLLILYRPSQAAEKIENNHNFWPPLLLLCLSFFLLGAVSGYFAPYLDPTMMEPGDSVEVVAIMMSVFMGLFMFFMAVLFSIIEALFLYGFAKPFKRKVSFRTLLTLTSFASLILEPGFLLINILNDPLMTGLAITGLGYWIPSSGMVAIVLDQIELSLIWKTIILFFAFRRIAKLTTLQAGISVGFFTLCSALMDIAMYEFEM
ncbi:YIP1 family protein [Shimazuella kribbensis]|uniref:YIP1 family protein n=1 Tax=Shimazuella kribbensis TaxID=139808 RepID=UPI00041277E8|nr:YIP1 family protein [Shimazuella kribbensis]